VVGSLQGSGVLRLRPLRDQMGKARPLGPIICADFDVSKRWEERKKADFNGRFEATLGAVRFPELALIFDDGRTERLPL